MNNVLNKIIGKESEDKTSDQKVKKPSKGEVLNEVCKMIYSLVSSSGIKENIDNTLPSVIIRDVLNEESVKAIIWDSIKQYLSQNILNEYIVQHTLLKSVFENDFSEGGPSIKNLLIEQIKKVKANLSGKNEKKIDLIKQTEIIFKNFMKSLKGELYIATGNESFNLHSDKSVFSISSLTSKLKISNPEIENSVEVNKIFEKHKQKIVVDTIVNDLKIINDYYYKFKNSVGADNTSSLKKLTNVGNYNYQTFLGNYIDLIKRYEANKTDNKTDKEPTGNSKENSESKIRIDIDQDIFKKYKDNFLESDIFKYIKENVKRPTTTNNECCRLPF